MYLAKNIRYLRRKYGYSQDFIAAKLGYKSYTTIQKWEMGVSEPSLKKLSELSALLQVNINDITGTDIELADCQKPDKESEKHTSETNHNSFSFVPSAHEVIALTAYHNQPNMQPAVDKLLGVEQKQYLKLVGRGGTTTVELTDEQIQALKEDAKHRGKPMPDGIV